VRLFAVVDMFFALADASCKLAIWLYD
jgi:hypothetical protein